MSFDIVVQCFRNGELAKYPRAVVERAFAPFIKARRAHSWELEIGGKGGPRIYIRNEPEIHGFMVDRPGHDAFWKALMRVLRETGSVLYWPGGGAVVTSKTILAHLPPDLVEGVGRPLVTTDIEKIYSAMERR